MILQKKRIRKIGSNLKFLRDGQSFTIGVTDPKIIEATARSIGLPSELVEGQSILPAPVFGSVSRYNASGKELVHKDRPMETAYRQAEWCWQQWAGRGQTEEVCKIVDIPYKRYPRTYINPPGIEVTVAITTDGELAIVSPVMTLKKEDEEINTHIINLFLEMFGECLFFDEDMGQIIKPKIKKLNWTLLPPGERPWKSLRSELKPIIDEAPSGKRVVIENRLEQINKHKPDFAAVGNGGFHGYVVLGFKGKDLYVLESLLYGNATYVLGKDWKVLSQLTKKEILQDDLHEERIIHREGWGDRVDAVIST